MATKEKEDTKTNGDEYKYGVDDLADKLGVEPASARIKLRNANIKKAPTGRYGWKTKADLDEVVEKLNKKSAPAKEKAKEDDEPKKPAGKKAAGKKK